MQYQAGCHPQHFPQIFIYSWPTKEKRILNQFWEERRRKKYQFKYLVIFLHLFTYLPFRHLHSQILGVQWQTLVPASVGHSSPPFRRWNWAGIPAPLPPGRGRSLVLTILSALSFIAVLYQFHSVVQEVLSGYRAEPCTTAPIPHYTMVQCTVSGLIQHFITKFFSSIDLQPKIVGNFQLARLVDCQTEVIDSVCFKVRLQLISWPNPIGN